jgi:hypothetical protein
MERNTVGIVFMVSTAVLTGIAIDSLRRRKRAAQPISGGLEGLRIASTEWVGGAEQRPDKYDPANLVRVRTARFLVDLDGKPREVVAEGRLHGDEETPGYMSSIQPLRPVVVKVGRGAKLWPTRLDFQPPNPMRRQWLVGASRVLNTRSPEYVVGWNDAEWPEAYYSHHRGAQER